MTQKIKDLFAGDIYRRIEEVIKVDQTDEQVIREEMGEYIVTSTIRDHFREILDRYYETLNKPHEGIGIWVSGFFGSGKSSFAKMLGLGLQNRTIQDQSAAKLLAERAHDNKITILLNQISERIPTDAVVFDVSTDRGIRSGNQMLTEIMYRLFLKSLGYANDLDLAELEITLEQKGQLEGFAAKYRELFDQEWDHNKDLISFSLGEASAVMHALYPERYAAQDTWIQAVQDRADINPGRLAERCKELMTRRRSHRHLVFVIDEVGQFVSKDVQKMLDLQAIIQNMGRVGRGKLWVIVTSQEKLTELVGGLDDKRVELARLMDRFTLQIHLEPSDISEVTSKRVLAKNAPAEKRLRELYAANSGRLTANTRLSADITLPELSEDRFRDLYPLLPYHIDLIINVVSGLRLQGGASKHVGGANRTIIKLAQQLLIHEKVALAEQSVGTLARIDQIYDLVAGNLPSELRGKIEDIRAKVSHPLAQPVAKAICLLQFVKSIHRTAENIAAALHPGVDSDSRLAPVREALQALVDSHQVRLADNQYRIPSPAEDDWEVVRASFKANPGDINRLHTDIINSLWEPKPSHNFLDAKIFKAGLSLNGRIQCEEDIPFLVTLADAATDYDSQAQEARKRSQSERTSVFWVAGLDEKIDRETVELYRSREILARKERAAKTKDETALVKEEKTRMGLHESELRRLL
ncbi:MAG: BREX system P-loop protein BrxC, partial [Pseudomonadota bacterium]